MAGDAGNGHVGVLTTTTQAEGANDGGSSKRKLSADCGSREGEDHGEMSEGPGARDCRAEQGDGSKVSAPKAADAVTEAMSEPGSGSPSSDERGAGRANGYQTVERGGAPNDDSSDNSHDGGTEHVNGIVSLGKNERKGKDGKDGKDGKNTNSAVGGPQNDSKVDSVDRNSASASGTVPLLTDTSNNGGPNGNARASSSVHYSVIDAVGSGASGSSFMDEGILTSADSADPHSLYGSFTWKVPKFHEVSKRELKSSSFSVGPYKWYILVYPNGCDVSNHLSLFLCVADYDKLLPGWSHFAQFTIAVVNKDPKKSKYSDTLHRFCKKEHDWGWKKFMELGKMQDGFVVSDTLVIKVQVQVIKDRMTAPFRTLDCHYRRELIRVYLSNIEGIVRRFIDKTKEKVRGLLKDDAMGDFWGSISQKEKLKLASTPAAPLLKNFTKVFFNEKEVTSTLMMDAAFCAMKVMDCRHRFLIEGKKIPDSEEDSNKEDYVNPLERYIRSINESWHSLHLDGTKGVFKFEKMDFVSPIAALSMFIEPIWMGNLRYIEVSDSSKKGGKAAGAGGDSLSPGSGASGMPTSTKGLVDLNLTMFTEEKCFTLPGEMDELKLVTAARLALEAFAMEHIAEQIESARKEAEIIRMQEELIREEEEAHKDQAAKKAKQAEAEREKKARKREKQRAKQEAERAKQAAEAEQKALEEEQKRREKELKRQEMEEKRRTEEAAMEAERQKLLLERERKMKSEMEKREKERLAKQQRLLLEKAERERAEKLEKDRERQLKREQQEQREQREHEVRSNHSYHSDISRQDSLDGSIAALSDQSGPVKAPSVPTSPIKAGASLAAPVPIAGGDFSSAKALSAMKVLLQSRDEEIERLREKVSSLEAELEKALVRLSNVPVTAQKKSASSPSQNIANISQQHLNSHAYMLQQMAMNPPENILGVSGVSGVSSVPGLAQSTVPRSNSSHHSTGYNASYPIYGGNTSPDGPVRQTGARVTPAAPSVPTTGGSVAGGSTTVLPATAVPAPGVSDAVEAGVHAATDDFDSAFAHLGLVESLLD